MSDSLVSNLRWYALYVRSRFEKKVDRVLQEKGVESFLPITNEIHRWSDRKKKIKELLFRGYVFVHTDLQNKYNILATDGVVYIVGVHGKPTPIPEEQINWLKILIQHPQVLHRENAFSSGERVKIFAGPFTGIKGVVTKVKGSSRVVILIDAIRQAISVDVTPDILQRIGE